MLSTAPLNGPRRRLVEQDLACFGMQSSFVDTLDVLQVLGAFRIGARSASESARTERPRRSVIWPTDEERI